MGWNDVGIELPQLPIETPGVALRVHAVSSMTDESHNVNRSLNHEEVPALTLMVYQYSTKVPDLRCFRSNLLMEVQKSVRVLITVIYD